MSVETRIGKRLAAIREHRRMSQADLAAALGVSKAAIGHYERGKVRLTVMSSARRSSNCRLGLVATEEKNPRYLAQLSTVFQPVRVAYSHPETNSSIY